MQVVSMIKFWERQYLQKVTLGAYLESSRTSMVELFAKIVSGFHHLAKAQPKLNNSLMAEAPTI